MGAVENEWLAGRYTAIPYPYTGLVVKPGLVPNHTTLSKTFFKLFCKANYLTIYKNVLAKICFTRSLVILYMSCASINFCEPQYRLRE